MLRKSGRWLCILLLLLMGFSTAMADGVQGIRVYVYAYAVKVYESPSKKSALVAEVPFAQAMTCIAESKGWAQVITPDNRTGYCSAKQLTETDPNTFDTTIYAQQNKAPVYERPTVDAPMIAHMNKNEKATLLAMTPSGDWLRIRFGSYDGYIQRPRVDFKKYASGKAAWVISDSVSVRYDQNIDSSIGEMSRGQKVTVVGVDGDWAKIRSGSGLIGYCPKDALTTKKPN